MMATSLSFLALSLSLALFLLGPSAVVVADKRPVLDSDGNELESGVDYYINGKEGGGLSLGSRNTKFPFNVMQHHHKQGRPLGFALATSAIDGIVRRTLRRSWAMEEGMIAETPDRHTIIHESTDLNIQFSNISAVWQVLEADMSGTRFVTIGGHPGHPGPSTINNWFKIERVGEEDDHTYKIVHCPSVCGSCKTVCGSIGVSSEHGTRWLSVQDSALEVMFVRVKSS